MFLILSFCIGETSLERTRNSKDYIRGTWRFGCFGAKALEASLEWFGHERTKVRRMVL